MPALSDNLRGALLMMASMAAFTFNDTFVKSTGGAVPLNQLLFLRGTLTSVLVLILALHLRALRFDLARRDWILIALRTLVETGAAYFFLTALFNMPIANVTAILQILPLTVTLGGALFFREKVGWRRMLAIAVGFGGMILIVRPGPDGFSEHAIYALIAVVMVTVRDLVTRRMSRDVPSMTVTFVTALGITLAFGGAALGDEWVALSLRNGLLIAGSSVFIFGGYLFSVMVMRVGDVGFVAPFRYTGLIWALLLGLVVFGDWPDAITLLGAAIVVLSGIFNLYREARLARLARRSTV